MADTNPNETIYDDPARGTISYATSAKLAINIQGVELSEDVLRINFTDSVTGTFDSETGTATIPITPGAQQAPQWAITGRISSGIGILENFDISLLEDDTEPSDIELLGKRTGDGNLVKVGVGNLPTAGGGEANLGSNVGTGFGTFDNKSGVTLNMRSINPLNLLEGAINAQSVELGIKDTTQGFFIAREDVGSGEPTFVSSTSVFYRERFQGNLPKSVIATSRALTQVQDYKRLVDMDNDGGTVALTLPDPTGAQFAGQEPGHFCDIRVRSGANIASITTAVTGNFRHQNGYGTSSQGTEDTIFLGYRRNRGIGQVYRLYRETDRWIFKGDYRTVETQDLTLDGPIQVLTATEDAQLGTDTVSINEATHGGTMPELSFAGAVSCNVSSLSTPGLGIELHKVSTGDVTMVGVTGPNTTIPTGEARLVRVRSNGDKYLS